MNKIYHIVWNAVLQQWVVTSELSKGKKKSTVNGAAKNWALSLSAALTLLMGSSFASAAVELDKNWTPSTKNSTTGYSVTNGDIVDIIGPEVVDAKTSGLVALNIKDAIDKGFTTGDNLVGKLYIGTGTASKSVMAWDDALKSYVPVTVYNSAEFSQRAAGSAAAELAYGFSPTSDFFYKTRFVEVQSTGGVANVNLLAPTVGLYFKDSQLAFADGSGTETSKINWNSQNYFYMSNAASVDYTNYQLNIKSMEYNPDPITFTIGGTSYEYTLKNVDDLKAYNNFLVEKLTSGAISASTYNELFDKAIISTAHSYDVDRTAGGSIDETPYTSPLNRVTIMTASGANAEVRVSEIGKLMGSAPRTGAILAIGGGTGINDGIIDMTGIAMEAASDKSSVINNGTIYSWFVNTTGNQQAHGEGMKATAVGAKAINNGTINVRPFANPNANPKAKNQAMYASLGGQAINNGVINLSPSAKLNDTISATLGAWVRSAGATFTNAASGKITIGEDFESATNTTAIEVEAGAGLVENAGLIYMGKQAQGAFGIHAVNAPALNVVNSGIITIEGEKDGLNVGLYADNAWGMRNTGTINLAGINGVGIKAINAGQISSSGGINVKGTDASSGVRNYGGWGEGAGSKLDISGEVRLSGDGAIGLHARAGSSIDLTGNGVVKFINGTKQIGFFVYGANSVINNLANGEMNVSTVDSTLFRIASGAAFSGSAGSSGVKSKLTASGKDSEAIVISDTGSRFDSGDMTIDLTGEGAIGVTVEGGATGTIASTADIALNNASAIAGIADGDGHDIAGVITNPYVTTTKLTASAQLDSVYDKVTGYIARNGATLDNAGNINFTGKNTVGIQVMDGSIGENSGSITLQDGGIGLLARSSNLTTTINNTGNLNLNGGSNANRTKGIQASGSAVAVNMTGGNINMNGQGAIGVEALEGGTVRLNGTALPKFDAEGNGATDQIAFRIVGKDSTIITDVQAGILLDASGINSTLFRVEDGASQSGILQMRTSGENAIGIWATGVGTSVIASSNTPANPTGHSDFQIEGDGAMGVYITGGAVGILEKGTTVNLVGDGAVVGKVDGNEYDLAGDIIATNTGSTLTNESDISTPLSNAIGFISQNQGLLVNKGEIDFTAGAQNIGVKIINGKFENESSDIKVNGVAVYVEGADSLVKSTGGTILASDGEAAIKLGKDASLNLNGSGIGIVEGQGSAHGVLLDTGAKGLVIAGAKINVNADSTIDPTVKTSTGNGVENKAEIAGLQLTGTAEINVADGKGIRTAATLAHTNSGTINISGSGTGLAFETATGGVVENTSVLDMSDSKELVINLNSSGGTGILVNTMDSAMVKTGASVNVNQIDGGSALVVNNSAKEVIQSGNLISSSTTAAVVQAEKVRSFTNKGKILANSITAEAMSFDGKTNTVLVNDTDAEIQGVTAMNGGNNNVTNKGKIIGTLIAADGNNIVLFEDGSTLTGNATLGQGNNQVTLNGTAHADEVTAGGGINTFTIKGTGATYNLLDGGLGAQDSLIFDAAAHTVALASKLQNFEFVKLKNQSMVTINEALTLTDNGTGPGAVDIESESELAIKPTLAGDFVFDPQLTGSGILSAELDADTSAFNLSSNVGSDFKGTLRLATSSFNLASLNTFALTQAALQSDTGNITTVGAGAQNIGGLTINGGKLIFGSVMPGDITSANSIVTSAAGTLDIRGSGTVQVTMPSEVINDVPALDSRKSLFEQDDEITLVKLVTAQGSVLGNGSAIILQDENGNVISNAQTFDINQLGTIVAEGIYDYKLMNGDGNIVDGLYIGYGLTQLDLQGIADDALILTPNANATGKSADLSAKITGTGDLAIEAGTQAVSLSNRLNDYTGETTVRNGTLVMANDDVLGKTANLNIDNGATFKTTDSVGAYSQTIGALNTADGASVVLAENSALTISDVLRATDVVDGGTLANNTLSGAGALNVITSELVVNGANAGYSGDVSLSGTSLATLNGAQGFGSQGTIHIDAADDRLDINIDPLSGFNTNLSKLLSGAGLVSLLDATDLTVSGNNTDFSGVFNVKTDAMLRASEQKNLGSSVIENDGVTYLTTNAKWKLENSITGSGALVKQGLNRLVVNHDLTYTGETTIESGSLIIGDSAANVGTFALGTGGLLSGSSKVNVLSGAILSGLGEITGAVDNQGTIASLNALNGYEINNVNNFNVGSLTNSGVIQLAGSNTGNTLTVNGDYTGGGTLVINTVLNDDSSATDKLIVTGNTSGDTAVIVNNINGLGQQTVNGIEVVNVGGLSDGVFKLKNRAVAGAYEYFLNQGGVSTPDDGDWYLRSQMPQLIPDTPVTPTPTDNIIRPEAGSYMANMAAASQMFNLRLEDREGRAENSSMWLRQEGSRTKFRDTTGQSRTTTNSYLIQGGGELWNTHFNDNDRLGVGLMAAYGNASSKTGSNRTGYNSKGTVDGYSTGVYATWYQDAASQNGVYVDSWVQYSWLNGEVKGEQLSNENYDISGLSASVETGYRMPVYQGQNGNVFITPQAQITLSGITADDHQEVNGTQVTSSGDNNIQTRLGVKVSRDGVSDGDKGKDKLFTVYAEANWLNNSQQAGAVLNGVEVRQSGSRNLGELKLGAEGQLNSNLNLWTNIGQQLGDNGYSDTSVNLGVKVRF